MRKKNGEKSNVTTPAENLYKSQALYVLKAKYGDIQAQR